MTFLLTSAMLYIMEKRSKNEGCILSFQKEGDLGLENNYIGIRLTSIAAKNIQLTAPQPRTT